VAEMESASESGNESEVDDELESALNVVRALGHSDGRALAEGVIDALYEESGEAPSLEELSSVWQQIQDELAEEAEEEAADSEDDDEGDYDDYDPSNLNDQLLANQDAVEDHKYESTLFGAESDDEAETEGESEDEEWEEALDHIRDLAANDGAVLAQDLCDIFYAEYGAEPSLEELHELWNGVQDELAVEAQSENEVESADESVDDDDTESESEDEYEEALEHIRGIAKLDGEAMASNLCQIMLEENGEEPSLEELTEIWSEIVDEFAAEAQSEIESEDESEFDEESESESQSVSDHIESEEVETESDDDDLTMESELESVAQSATESEAESEEEADGDYEPSNMNDEVLARWDLEEDRQHELDYFGGEMMLNTPMVRSQRGHGVSWNVYFDEDDLSRRAESSNLKEAMEGFKVRNQRAPTIEECKNMAAFLAVPNELCNEADIQPTASSVAAKSSKSKSRVFVSPLIEKKTAQRFSVYLEDGQQGDADVAIRLFQRSNDRQPNAIELAEIKAFVKVDADLTEATFAVTQQQRHPAVDRKEDVAEESAVPTASTVAEEIIDID